MKDRIKQVRKTAKLTQVDFGKRLGVAGNTITNYENGMREPSNAVIIAICREFGINEEWLRYGKGEMLVFSDLDDIKKLIIEYVNSTNDTYVLNLFATMSKFSQTEWDILKLLLKKLLDNM